MSTQNSYITSHINSTIGTLNSIRTKTLTNKTEIVNQATLLNEISSLLESNTNGTITGISSLESNTEKMEEIKTQIEVLYTVIENQSAVINEIETLLGG